MKKQGISILLLAAIVLLINVLARQYFFRLDLTEGKQYTLSKATKDILKDLEDPVTIKAYFSKDLPSTVAKTKTDFQDLLIEYSNRSKGLVNYEFIDPNSDEAIEQEAVQAGIRPVMINVREKDQVKQQKAFLGAVLSLGEQSEVIPFVQPGGAMEYDLTTNIKKLSILDKPAVALLQGHGEPSAQELSQIYQQLSILYNVEALDLTSTDQIDPRFNTVAIIAPKDTFRFDDFSKLDAFLSRGGNLLIAFDRVSGDLQQARGEAIEIGLANWLTTKGLTVEPAFAVDRKAGAVTMQQRQGFFTINTQVEFPFLPLIQSFPDHPATTGLEQVIFEFASPIQFSGDSSMTFTPLVTTSEKAGVIQAPTFFDVNKQWTDLDFPQRNLPIGAMVSGDLMRSGIPSKLVVFTDGNFAVSGQRGQNPDNINLVVNTIDWMSDDTGLIALRTKGIASRPIEELEDGRRAFLKYLNFLLPLVLVIAYGIFRSQRNKNVRLKRMQERWV